MSVSFLESLDFPTVQYSTYFQTSSQSNMKVQINKLERDFDLQVRNLYIQINLKYVLSKVKHFQIFRLICIQKIFSRFLDK